jgi:hypothetical protein
MQVATAEDGIPNMLQQNETAESPATLSQKCKSGLQQGAHVGSSQQSIIECAACTQICIQIYHLPCKFVFLKPVLLQVQSTHMLSIFACRIVPSAFSNSRNSLAEEPGPQPHKLKPASSQAAPAQSDGISIKP